jgi:vitamin B12 transporter
VRRWLLPAASALTLLPVLGRAAGAAPPAQEVVVSASRLATPGIDRTYSVATISAGQMAGRQSVGDALGGLAEIYVQAPGGRSGVASIFLRGADPNFTAVLLDGVALNDSTSSRGGAVNVAAIDTAALARIEVVSGPMSSIHGSGALAGAIDLAVPGGTPQSELEATVSHGTAGDYAGSLRVTGPLSTGLGGSLSLTGSDDGDVSPGSRFSTWSATGKIAPLHATDSSRLILRASGSDADAFPDSSGGRRLAARRTLQSLTSREFLLGLDQRVMTRGALSLDLLGSYLQRVEDTTSPGVAPSQFDPVGLPVSLDHSTYRRGMLQAVARHERSHWSSAGGLEMQTEQGDSAGQLLLFGQQLPNAFAERRRVLSAFAEGAYAATRWSVNAGARVDDVESRGAHLTARAGARYTIPRSGLTVRASAGTGFKAPSFYALGNPLVGNAALRPESSASGELGLDWRGATGVTASMTGFQVRYVDLIDFDPGPPPRLVNRSAVVARGVAAAFVLPVGRKVMLSARAQYADTVNAAGTQLLNRPRWRATTGLTWQAYDRLSFSLRDSYVSGRNDFAIPTGVRALGAYHLLAAEAALAVSSATLLRLVVDNAMDRAYEEAVGFPAPGARARLMLTQKR